MVGSRLQDFAGVLWCSQPTQPIGHTVDRAGHRSPRMPQRVGGIPVAHRDLAPCRIECEHDAPAAAGAHTGGIRRPGSLHRAIRTRHRHCGTGPASDRTGGLPTRPPGARGAVGADRRIREPRDQAGTEVVVLDRVVGPAPLRFDHPAGAELAVHTSAMGKVLLAFSGTSIADEMRTLDVLQPFTTRTIVDRAAFAAELADVVTRGYATNNEERYDGVSGIAAPVRSPGGFAACRSRAAGPKPPTGSGGPRRTCSARPDRSERGRRTADPSLR